VSKGTVIKYIHAEGFPELQPRPPRRTLLAPFMTYLRDRWAAGCQNATQLWLELRQQGFTGGHTIVADCIKAWRCQPPIRPTSRQGGAVPAKPISYGPRQVCWLLLCSFETLTIEEQAFLTRLYHACPQVALAEALVEEFAGVLRSRDVEGFYAWLRGVEMSGILELRGVARGMWLDRAAVVAAVAKDFSNGHVAYCTSSP
jgi:transposase